MFIIVFSFALMASAITANKFILNNIPFSLLVTIRMLAAGLILLFYTIIFDKKYKISWFLFKSNLSMLLLISISTTFIPSLLKAYALQNLPSYRSAFFGSLDPFFTSLYAYFVFKENLSLNKIIGIMLVFISSLILIVNQNNFEFNYSISIADIAAILATMISRLGWIMAQKLLKKEVYSPIQINSIIMIISGLLSFIIYCLSSDSSMSLYFIFKKLDFKVYFALFYTIVVGNIISYNLYAKVLKNYSTILVSIAGFLVPIFVSLYGFLILSELPPTYFYLSLFTAFLGALIFFQDNS